MSLSDAAASQDYSEASISTTAPATVPIVHLHPPLALTALDPALSLHPKQQHNPIDNTIPQTSLDDLPNQSCSQQPGESLLIAVGDEADEEEDPEKTCEELALLLKSTRKRGREPPPGTKRVMKTVRIRKGSSSSKRRTKKHTLRVHLKESARIEEEMAEHRRKGKGKGRPVPERRLPVAGPGSSSQRRPSGLRFSESCYSDKEDEVEEEGYQEEEEEEDEFMDNIAKDREVSMEWQQGPHDQSNSEAPVRTMDWKTQIPPHII